MKKLTYYISIVLVCTFVQCKNISKYPIDYKAVATLDSRILGVWRGVEDTIDGKYILIQNNNDLIGGFIDMSKKTTVYNNRKEDAKRIEEMKRQDKYVHLSYMADYGTGDNYREWRAFISVVNKSVFFNLHYFDEKVADYFTFIRFIKINKNFDSVTAAVVADTTMRYLTSPAQVRKRIEERFNDPTFYKDTMHFYKVSSYHARLWGAAAHLDRLRKK